jgi:hypothetical protein
VFDKPFKLGQHPELSHNINGRAIDSAEKRIKFLFGFAFRGWA